MKKITKILLPILTTSSVVVPMTTLSSCSEYQLIVKATPSDSVKVDHTRWSGDKYSIYLTCDTTKTIKITSITSASIPLTKDKHWKMGSSGMGGCSLTIYTDQIPHAAEGRTIITINCSAS